MSGDAGDFYDRLSRVTRGLQREAGEALPTWDELDRAHAALAELRREAAAADDLERRDAVDAALARLGRLAVLLEPRG